MSLPLRRAVAQDLLFQDKFQFASFLWPKSNRNCELQRVLNLDLNSTRRFPSLAPFSAAINHLLTGECSNQIHFLGQPFRGSLANGAQFELVWRRWKLEAEIQLLLCQFCHRSSHVSPIIATFPLATLRSLIGSFRVQVSARFSLVVQATTTATNSRAPLNEPMINERQLNLINRRLLAGRRRTRRTRRDI